MIYINLRNIQQKFNNFFLFFVFCCRQSLQMNSYTTQPFPVVETINPEIFSTQQLKDTKENASKDENIGKGDHFEWKKANPLKELQNLTKKSNLNGILVCFFLISNS